MTKSSVLLLACCMILQAHAGTSAVVKSGWFAPKGNGSFSAVAKNACRSVARTPPDLTSRSPDGKKKIVVPSAEDGEQTFVVDESGKKFSIQTEGWPCPEIGWSPASDHFFLSYSDGGNVGTYHLAVYGLAEGKLAHIPLTQLVRQDFLNGYPKCFEPEEPNIMGIAWSHDATRLLVAAQVLPHTNCDNMGTFKLYELAVPSGAIIRRFSQAEAKSSFRKLLGPALRSADDHCFSEPGSCAIPMLHTSGDTHTVR
jgi:hypothetical protein